MKFIKNHRRSALTISILGIGVFLLTQCVNPEKHSEENPATAANLNLSQFAGSASCNGCHKNIYDSHIHTAHYLTTRPALPEYIKGSFEPGKNKYAYDSNRVVMMEKRDSGFYQVAYYKGDPKITGRFDIVVGSGSKGQTYITRYKNELYQLPVSYFTAAQNWANSPLYPVNPILFNRSITSRCLECHSTFAKVTSTPDVDPESFDSNIIFGVDCEKCHGPAAKHVAFQKENPNEKTGKFLLNPARFSRQQNLDLCGLCHGGRIPKTKPSFEFISGDKLSDFFKTDSLPPDPKNIDVHGNQLGLLRASKCFKMSTVMTCTTCHNPHQNERGKTALFSERCAACHNPEHHNTCKMTATLGPSISLNCIDCHMPLKASKSISELLPGAGSPTAALIRSHLIKIYPPEAIQYKSNPVKIK